jgi:hypothetical protein
MAIGTILILVTMGFPTMSMNVSADGTSNSVEQSNTLITDAHDKRVFEVDSAGNIIWEITGFNHPTDAERLDNGNTLIVDIDYPLPSGSVKEYTSEGNLVWQYTNLNTPYDAERLDNGNTLIADQHNHRVIEVNLDKQIVWKVDTNLKNTGKTYLRYPCDVERLTNGNTLIVDMYNNRIIEVEPDFDVIWESPWTGWPTIFDIERLDNGNTLIPFAVMGVVQELDFNFNVKWQTGVHYPVDVERLDNGNTLITALFAGFVIEVDSAGNIIWKYEGLNWPLDVERLEIITPEDAIENIIDDIEDMDLSKGTENSLISSLEVVLEMLKKGNDGPAVNKINALINHVEGLMKNKNDKQITNEQGAFLIKEYEFVNEAILESRNK